MEIQMKMKFDGSFSLGLNCWDAMLASTSALNTHLWEEQELLSQ